MTDRVTTYLKISELTAEAVTFRNNQGQPFMMTPAQWELIGKPTAISITVAAVSSSVSA